MDTTQWPQAVAVPKGTTITTTNNNILDDEKKVAVVMRPPQKNCPRCNSTNTKFCYYNNYSLTQPRYFCKTCTRYWTAGGTLRNVPVGGGSRKNKKSSSSSSLQSSSLISHDNFSPQNPNSTTTIAHKGQDNLNLEIFHGGVNPQFTKMPKVENHGINKTTNSFSSPLSALELLKGASRGLSPFLYQSSMFAMQGFIPAGSSSSRYGFDQEINVGKLMFPPGGMRGFSGDHHHDQVLDHRKGSQGGNSTGYWNGILGGGI